MIVLLHVWRSHLADIVNVNNSGNMSTRNEDLEHTHLQ